MKLSPNFATLLTALTASIVANHAVAAPITDPSSLPACTDNSDAEYDYIVVYVPSNTYCVRIFLMNPIS